MTSSQHLYIESDANPRLKRWRRLALEAKAVRREGATVLKAFISCRPCSNILR